MKKIIIISILVLVFFTIYAGENGGINYRWLKLSYSNFLSPFSSHNEYGESSYFEIPGSYSREYLNDNNSLSLIIRPFGNLLLGIDYGKGFQKSHDVRFEAWDMTYSMQTTGTIIGLHLGYRIADQPDMYIDVFGGYFKMEYDGIMISSLDDTSDYSTSQEAVDIYVELRKMFAGYGLGAKAGWILWNNYDESVSILRYSNDRAWCIDNRTGSGFTCDIFYIFNFGPMEINAGISALRSGFDEDTDIYNDDWSDDVFESGNGGNIMYWGPRIDCGFHW